MAVSTILTAAFFAVGLITSGVVSSFVSSEMDEQLRAKIMELKNAYISGGLTRLNQSLLERAATLGDDFVYQLVDPSGKKISGHLAELPASAVSINSRDEIVFEVEVSMPDGRNQIIEFVSTVIKLPDESKLLVGASSRNFKRVLFAVQSTFMYSAFVVIALYALSLFYFFVIDEGLLKLSKTPKIYSIFTRLSAKLNNAQNMLSVAVPSRLKPKWSS